jgi:hypothetical protein
MQDIDGPIIAKQVYESLLEKEVICIDDVPYALDDAVACLRRDGADYYRWATFVHMGA